MELKEYQIAVLERLEKFLQIVSEQYTKKAKFYRFEQSEGETGTPPDKTDYLNLAWTAIKTQYPISSAHQERTDELGRQIPNVCFKIPTGGGKTLLATHAITRIQQDYFKKSNGFLLWVVPSETIYRQTSKQLRNREHPYRQMLDRTSGGRTKILEKNDKFNPQDINDNLCVMLLMLQSGNRDNKDTLRMFRDSGGFTNFFPEVDDHIGNEDLLNRIPNLDCHDLADSDSHQKTGHIKHSLGNVMKIIRPVVIIDEGHRATSQRALETINNFYPQFILELSATPKPISNVLVDIKGKELKDESMIKLPIHISAHGKESWQATLNYANDKLLNLHADASQLQQEEGRYIRPIMLIKAEPKAKDSTTDHVEEIKQYLIEKLQVPEQQIRIKLSEKNEIKNEDLLDNKCPVRYIITKDALKEGWDCPFAYILTILTTAKSETALTQFIGRVLRQPDATLTPINSLNKAYVYCMDEHVEESVNAIKDGLEAEGMGDISNEVTSNGTTGKKKKIQNRNKKYQQAIFLPQLNINKKGKKARLFCYYRDILAQIDWQEYNFSGKINLQTEKLSYQKTAVDIDNTQTQLNLNIAEYARYHSTQTPLCDKSLMVSQLIDKVPNPFQANRIITKVIKKHKWQEATLAQHGVYIVEEIKKSCLNWLLEKSENIFRDKLESGEIFLQLIASPLHDTEADNQLNWVMPDEHTVFINENEDEVTNYNKNIFQPQYRSLYNGLEHNIALHINKHEAVKWWHRLGVSGTEYHVQGWQRNKIYPDFLVKVQYQNNQCYYQFIETKGNHLKGNDDTNYKKKVFEYLNKLMHSKIEVKGDFTLLAQQQPIKFNMVFEQTEQNSLQKQLNALLKSQA